MKVYYAHITLKCPVCGKEFQPAPFHALRIGTEWRGKPVCSYSCMRKWEREQEEKEKARKEARRKARKKKGVK